MVSIAGVVVLIVLYLLVLAVGVFAARWFRHKHGHAAGTQTEVALVAGRKIGGVVGVFTMTATIVGGGYINGTAESIAKDGLVWTLAPFGIFIGLIIGGVVYARHMREKLYLTMFDPFQDRYGNVMVGLLYLAAMASDVLWSASILIALGTSLSVIIGLSVVISIIISAVVAIIYVEFGQMVAVAYTDVIQLLFIIVGLLLCLPFIFVNPLVSDITTTSDAWLGQIDTRFIGLWIDLLIAMTFGTIPWQSYFQRVLSVRTAGEAQVLSIIGACGALLLAVPSLVIGATAVSADWNQTEYGSSPVANDSSLVLPLVLHNFTPLPVAILGLGAISAAVMSSLDSAVLASASLFTHNIYKSVIRSQASEREVLIVHRIAVLAVGAIATIMALSVPTIYGMFILAADLVFVIMFPQLTAVLFIPSSNTYGAFCGYFVGLLLRLGAGEPFISLPAFIYFPFYSSENGQLFPFRTLAMASSLFTIIIVSLIAKFLFTHKWLPPKMDICHCFSSALAVDSTTESAHALIYSTSTDAKLNSMKTVPSTTPAGYSKCDDGKQEVDCNTRL